MNERKIIVNGTMLSDGQAATLRMALGCLKLDLHQASATDTLGSQEVAQHLKNLRTLDELIGSLAT
jgi:hypothetical protein